jgi:hypothetical protein
VLDFLLAVGQFLCLVSLLCGLLLALLSGRYAGSSASQPDSARENADDRGRPQATVQLAVLPEKPVALIKIVPIESSPLLNGPNALAKAKSAREQRKPSPRRVMQEAINRARGEERAALLMKHARKPPGSDGPRVAR